MNPFRDVRSCLLRDLDGFVAELQGYPDERQVWALPAGFANSTGTLALHAAGNLRHFIGTVLGSTGYVRDREHEFSARDVPRSDLIAGLEAAKREVGTVLAALDPSRADAPFPIAIREYRPTTMRMLVHLTSHLAWHLGQADYHRRTVTGMAQPVAALGLQILAGND
ncbi:MAG TPA: DUF664 domain-containing protein [Gemmatimonadales bacterium]|nr:DUF664 domain-containing protein [Gemmatimonadales bacterium]